MARFILIKFLITALKNKLKVLCDRLGCSVRIVNYTTVIFLTILKQENKKSRNETCIKNLLIR